jgi:hypothetical protein
MMKHINHFYFHLNSLSFSLTPQAARGISLSTLYVQHASLHTGKNISELRHVYPFRLDKFIFVLIDGFTWSEQKAGLWWWNTACRLLTLCYSKLFNIYEDLWNYFSAFYSFRLEAESTPGP